MVGPHHAVKACHDDHLICVSVCSEYVSSCILLVCTCFFAFRLLTAAVFLSEFKHSQVMKMSRKNILESRKSPEILGSIRLGAMCFRVRVLSRCPSVCPP